MDLVKKSYELTVYNFFNDLRNQRKHRYLPIIIWVRVCTRLMDWNYFAIFQSVGKVLVISEKFIKCANGTDINSAASLIRTGGRSSHPIALFLVADFSCFSTSLLDTTLNMNL